MMSILQYGFMQRAFIVGILLAVITPCIGITIVLKRMSMIGDALSHASLAGVALGLLLGINPVFGAGATCIVAALGIEAIRKKIPRYSEMAMLSSAKESGFGVLSVSYKIVQILTAFIWKYCFYQYRRNGRYLYHQCCSLVTLMSVYRNCFI